MLGAFWGVSSLPGGESFTLKVWAPGVHEKTCIWEVHIKTKYIFRNEHAKVI